MAGVHDSDHGIVVAVSKSPGHTLIKPNAPEISLLPGLGVQGDAHLGTTVQHLSRIAKDPSKPNLRQVHLIHSELHQGLTDAGIEVLPGEMGENITTGGINLLGLPTGSLLKFAGGAIVEVTGLRNPCAQLNRIHPGLLAAVVGQAPDGGIVRKAGIMGIVLEGGIVRPGDGIQVIKPQGDQLPLAPV